MNLPKRNRALDPDGYVYLVSFSDGVIKVGQTNAPYSRIGAHTREAVGRGVNVTRVWVSIVHRNYQATEELLIAAASAMGTPAIGAEYFTDCNFDALIEVVTRAGLTPSTDEERAQAASQQKTKPTVSQLHAELFLPEGGVPAFIATRRAAKASWYDIALDLYLATEGKVKVTPETVRGWSLAAVNVREAAA